MGKSRKKFNKHSALEALRAQQNVGRTTVVKQFTDIAKSKQPLNDLPISIIKKDLVKDFAFAAFAAIFLVVLSKTQFGYTQLTFLLTL